MVISIKRIKTDFIFGVSRIYWGAHSINARIDVSNPTIDEQWETFKAAVHNSGINMEVVDEVLVALLKLTDSGGYGKINISVAGGLIQELRVETNKRLEKKIIKA